MLVHKQDSGRLMPKVGKKKFAYTKKGKKAADRAREKLKRMKPAVRKYRSTSY